MTTNAQKLLAWHTKFSGKKATEEDVSLVLASLNLSETKGKKSPIPKRRGSKSSEASAASSSTEGCPYLWARGPKTGTKCGVKPKDQSSVYCSTHRKKFSPDKAAAPEKQPPKNFSKNIRLGVFVNSDKYYGEYEEKTGHVTVLGKVVNGTIEKGLTKEDIEYCKKNKLKYTNEKQPAKKEEAEEEENEEEEDEKEEKKKEVKKPKKEEKAAPKKVPPKKEVKKSPAKPVKKVVKEDEKEEEEDEDKKSEAEEENEETDEKMKISTKIMTKAIGISEEESEEEVEEEDE